MEIDSGHIVATVYYVASCNINHSSFHPVYDYPRRLYDYSLREVRVFVLITELTVLFLEVDTQTRYLPRCVNMYQMHLSY